MTREEAIKILMGYSHTPEERAALETLIPELTESEDERIRKELIGMIKECTNWAHKKEYIAYLEKQKENPKSADSIPSDCTSDAKCEDRWHKVGDSMPDNPREVLCKDEARNYFIGRYYVGEGWEISNYDDEDKPHHLNPPVSKWIDFPFEKQKEQSITANDLDEEIKRFFDDCIDVHEVKLYGNTNERVIPVDCYELTARHFAKWGEKQKEQKPVEFTHHETNESLENAVAHQMEDDGNVDDFVRRGIDDIALKYAELGAKWQKEQKPEITLVGDGSPLRIIDKSELKMTLKEAIENLKLFRYRAIHSIKLEDSIDVVVEYLEKEQKKEWKPQPESLEALMYAIEGKWDMISPTSYLSRRLEDLYEGLVNTFNVDESLLSELPKVASRTYTAKDIEELRELKRKIEASMEQKQVWSEEDIKKIRSEEYTKGFNDAAFGGKLKEWSVEDGDRIRQIERIAQQAGCTQKLQEEIHDWLKSLRPQPHWKPSEEQMKALKDAFRKDGSDEYRRTINSLYQDLKKLM